jgi:hypothetical protein
VLKANNKVVRHNFCCDFQAMLDEDDFIGKLVFSDEATVHIDGKVNCHNCRIWGTENPHVMVEQEHNSPKVNMFCAISLQRLYGPFFFTDATVTGDRYLEMLQNWLMPQLTEESEDFIFQQYGAPSHFHRAICAHLNEHLPNCWIGQTRETDRQTLL